MEEKRLDQAPIWTNLKTFDGKPWRGVVDCITGGYPCQPFSVAGKKLGDKDPRHLWPEIKRLVEEIEPPICFFENVGGHLWLGFEEVANDLLRLGYQVKAGLFTAAEVGAPHKRERLFILAYRNGKRCGDAKSTITRKNDQKGWKECFKNTFACGNNFTANGLSLQQRRFKKPTTWLALSAMQKVLADSQNIIRQWREQQRSGSGKSEAEIGSDNSKLGNTNCTGLEGQCERRCPNQFPTWPPSPSDYERWDGISDDLKPAIHRMADGLADRVDRIRACGNGVVPLVAAYAWRTLTNGMYLTKNKLENHG
jgi:DNA (cytosine-5)-methyltransferase 1